MCGRRMINEKNLEASQYLDLRKKSIPTTKALVICRRDRKKSEIDEKKQPLLLLKSKSLHEGRAGMKLRDGEWEVGKKGFNAVEQIDMLEHLK